MFIWIFDLNPTAAPLSIFLWKSKEVLSTIPKWIFDQAAPRFELGVKDLQSPALPLGHAAKKSDPKSTKEQVFIHIFLLIIKTFFSFIFNLILLTFLESFSNSKNRFLLFWIQFRLFSSMDSILKHTLLTLENFQLLSILLRWQRRKSGFPVAGCKIQNKLEPLTII